MVHSLRVLAFFASARILCESSHSLRELTFFASSVSGRNLQMPWLPNFSCTELRQLAFLAGRAWAVPPPPMQISARHTVQTLQCIVKNLHMPWLPNANICQTRIRECSSSVLILVDCFTDICKKRLSHNK